MSDVVLVIDSQKYYVDEMVVIEIAKLCRQSNKFKKKLDKVSKKPQLNTHSILVRKVRSV